MFKEDLELREAVFKKMGAVWARPDPANRPTTYCWIMGNFEISIRFIQEKPKPDLLPPIEKSWEVCAKYLVPFMRGKGWEYSVLNPFMTGDGYYFRWEKDIREKRKK